MNQISIKKMIVFITVVDSNSFSEGAKRSFITQPAAAGIIDEIESTVGQDLFLRKGKNRRAELTDKGQEAYDVFLRAMRAYDDAISTLMAENGKIRKQKFLIQSPYVDFVSANWLTDVIACYRQMHLVIEQGSWKEIIDAVEDRQDCIALLDGDVKARHGELVPLGQTDLVLALPRNIEDDSYSMCDEITWEDVPENTIIFSGVCPQTLRQIYSRLRAANHLKSNFLEVGCGGVLRNCLEHGNLPALVPRNLIAAPGQGSAFKYLPIASSKLVVPLSLFIPYGNSLRNAFLDAIKSEQLFTENMNR